jgi:leucyl-tRNA synthetase
MDVVWKSKDELAKFFSVVEGTFVAGLLDNPDFTYTGEGPLVNSQKYGGLEGAAAKHAIIEDLFKAGAGKHATKYKLRDWIFSRQHYWGEPIPVIHCDKDGIVPVPADQLPVELPKVEHYEPTDTGESPLAAMTDWVNVKCPKCGGPAKRETDTMPNWAGSSWYFLRYADPKNDQAFADRAKLDMWSPVTLYNGGMEHTTLHLLYSRFWHKFLYDQGLVPAPEPYAARRSHGMILAPDSHKMSKSRGNVINPDDVIKHYGADALRIYEMFMGPFEDATSWSDERLGGISRFLVRIWKLAQELHDAHNHTPSGQPVEEDAFSTAVDRSTHKTLKKVHGDIESMAFNTMVSALMEHLNYLTSADVKAKLLQPQYAALAWRTLRTLILMIAPAAPHVAEELWHQIGEEGSVHAAAWPKYDPKLIQDDLVELAVQVNGKLRGTITVPVDASEDELKELAAAQESVAKYLDGQTIAKTIVVPRKIVNFVVR